MRREDTWYSPWHRHKHIYSHTYTHKHLHTHACTCVGTGVHTCMYSNTCMQTKEYVHIFMHTYMYPSFTQIHQKIKIFYLMCMHVCAYMYVCALVICRNQERVSDPPELELQALVGCPIWVLGTELGSSTKAASTLNHWTISSGHIH